LKAKVQELTASQFMTLCRTCGGLCQPNEPLAYPNSNIKDKINN